MVSSVSSGTSPNDRASPILNPSKTFALDVDHAPPRVGRSVISRFGCPSPRKDPQKHAGTCQIRMESPKKDLNSTTSWTPGPPRSGFHGHPY